MLNQLKSLEPPLMVVCGTQDKILPVSHAYRALKQAPEAKLHVFDQCGQWPHMEKADGFNSLVLDFLSD